jgi:ribosomal RNA-processing protein 1
MDKFLYLVRVYVRAAWTRLEREGWSDEVTAEYLQVLEDIPLNPDDMKIPDGMRYHLIDLYIDELEEAGLLKSDEGDQAELEKKRELVKKLLGPLERIGKESPNKVVREKVKEALDDERIVEFLGEAPAEEAGKDDEWDGIDD